MGGGERQGRAGRDRPGQGGVPERRGADRKPYVTPDEADSCWKKPGPAAGPFEAKLGDGSVVTYYWYRFADQPALLNADLTDAERESTAEAGGDAAPELDEGPRLPSAPDGRQARRPRSRGPRDPAEGPGSRLRADRHPTGCEGLNERALRDKR